MLSCISFCFVAYILSVDSSCIAAVSASVAVSLLCVVVLSILGSVSLMRACACAHVYISHRLCGGGAAELACILLLVSTRLTNWAMAPVREYM